MTVLDDLQFDMPHLDSTNTVFVEELYQSYLDDPSSVDPSWSQYFKSLEKDAHAFVKDKQGASWAPRATKILSQLDPEEVAARQKKGKKSSASEEDLQLFTQQSIRALMLIRAYRVRGHLHAKLDPLNLQNKLDHPELDYKSYGFTDDDLDKEIFINDVLGLKSATLRKIIKILEKTYCGHVGVEFMHIQDPDEKSWIQHRIEASQNRPPYTPDEKKRIYQDLIEAQEFEQFLDKKYTGTKRFGLDGAEAAIPGLEAIVEKGVELGVEEVVIGMPHRGRLNILANIMGKPFRAIFSEFQGNSYNMEEYQGSGDVKYHLGTSSDRKIDGKNVHLSLTANPSHLEAVNPVVLGKVRAKQKQLNDQNATKVLGLLLHGDAAFAGQGIVAESLMLSQLEGYKTGGTIHFIVNNQIGFTTSPVYSRSGVYSTDVGKMVQAPIFHVNGDDVEAVVHVAKMAMEFRQEFHKDVIVDMVCYRRYGHNESDEPAFTQPLMYKQIADQPSTLEKYKNQLVQEDILSPDEANNYIEKQRKALEKDFELSQSYKPDKQDWLEGKWSGLQLPDSGARRGQTSVAKKDLEIIGKALTTVPDTFTVNRKLTRQLKAKWDAIKGGQNIDWATAEALAFGSLLLENVNVRLSGQDSGRGTFSQRHSMWIDQANEKRYIPLNNIQDKQAKFEVYDSPLSEMGVLGYEYGYSMAEPNMLVLWEAQFGDFVNGAQIIIDQFISSAEIKWQRMSGLVMLLPHGYEGQGPEHSSARMERFLQSCAQDNMQIANCTTPANYFHILRRQICRDFRKPLILFTPKSLLRHKECVSSIDEFTKNSTFHRVLGGWDLVKDPKKIDRIVVCSGKVYYDLLQQRKENKIENVALVRLEQLYPFPEDALLDELNKYPEADIVWCQEEPKNMGAWNFILPYFIDILAKRKTKQVIPEYAGRNEAAAPATGIASRHQAEQDLLVSQALGRKRKA